MDAQTRAQQMKQAEDLLGERKPLSFVKGLFFGRYLQNQLRPYPGDPSPAVRERITALQKFCREKIDPVAIDRTARIGDDVVRGLGDLGVLGACLPTTVGGQNLSQTDYCRLLQVLGGHCASTALFVNAHHSIGPRALVLFGTAAQQAKYLPRLASGEDISAFALTEPEAGSDAANVQTTARLSPDGKGYILNGDKRWITNGGIARVLTVMAKTEVPGRKDLPITAFVVTPDLAGFSVVEARMEKCGVRGTATSRLKFQDMFVPKENILGPLGKGLRVALTTLDYGRVTFGACCTGAAWKCVELAAAHAQQRVQFQQPLAKFELVQEKLAYMAAGAWAMEAATYQTAALIDSGADEYMLETAMLKVFATETLWRIINDCFQIHGGMAYFTDQPLERMLRDARINQIGEGANDVLRAFSALMGMRDVGLELQGVMEAISSPLSHLGRLGAFASRQLESLFTTPEVKVRSHELSAEAAQVGKLTGSLGATVQRLLRIYREEILERQHQLARVSDVATELFVGAAVLARIDALLQAADHNGHSGAHVDTARPLALARYYLHTSARRMHRSLAETNDNDDTEIGRVAQLVLKR